MFRSQIAQAIFNSNPVLGWQAFSSGTAVAEEQREGVKLKDWKGGIQIMIDKIQERYGVDISDECCKQVTEESVKKADKIIMMSEKEFIPEWLAQYESEYWQIPNPDIVTPDIADTVIDLLDKKIAILKNETPS